MKKIIFLLIILGLFGLSLAYHDEIEKYLVDKIKEVNKESSSLKNNKYASKNNYEFVRLTDDFEVKQKDDIKNIYYTILNSGMNKFTFYCSKDYENCVNDVDYVSNDKKLLSYINDFVPVYNSFSNMITEIDSLGKITVTVEHNYNDKQIDEIERKVTSIISTYITKDMDDEKKIKVIHDYINKNSKYDTLRSDEKQEKYHSNIAYGNLIEGFGICSGYTDTMKLFLDRFNIPNFKISGEDHIWNAVYLNNKWYHLDLTWDDTANGIDSDPTDYSYFLIDTNELLTKENVQHKFDTNIFIEFEEK